MPDLRVSNVRVHYVDKGEGKPLFLLHGNAGSSRVWRKVIPALSARYRVVAHDRQGFGDSEKLETGQFGPRDYALELCRFMDALGVEKAHIYGLSLGGMVAQCFALDYPDRTDGLVLVGTTPDRTGRSVTETIAELNRDGWSAVAERLTKSWFRPDSDPADIEEACQIALQSSQRMRELTVKALGTFDIKGEIRAIHSSTLILFGKEDITVPPKFAEMMGDAIPNSTMILIGDCAHLVPVEQPAAFAEHVVNFLHGVDAQSTTT